MLKAMKCFVRGFGSVIDIFPNPDFDRYAEETSEDRIRKSFEQVGTSLEMAIEQYRILHVEKEEEGEFRKAG